MTDDNMWTPPATLTVDVKLGHWMAGGARHVRALLEVLTKQGGYLSDEQLTAVQHAQQWLGREP